MRSATFQTGGLTGRIIPANPQQLVLRGYAPEADQPQAMEAISHVSETILHHAGAGVSFGTGADPLGVEKHLLRRSKLVTDFIRDTGEHEYDLLESKILVQASKVAVLLALCELADRHSGDPFSHPPRAEYIDAGPWLHFANELIAAMHLSNAYHLARLTEQGQQADRVLTLLRRRKRPSERTRRAICRSLNMTSKEAGEYLGLLLQDGAIEEGHDGRMIFYVPTRRK